MKPSTGGEAAGEAAGEGIFATIWNQHGGRLSFRIGLCALLCSMFLGAVLEYLNWGRSRTTTVVLVSLSIVTGILALILLVHCLYKYGALKSARVPRTEGEPAATKVRFKTPGIGPFGSGEGEIRFPEGLVRVVNWRREPWDVLVMIALWIILWNVGPLGCIGAAILVPATGLPRRRPTVEDLRVEEVASVEATPRGIVLTARGAEPFTSVTFTVKPTARAHLFAMLRARCPDAEIVDARKPAAAPTGAELDARLARLRSLRDAGGR